MSCVDNLFSALLTARLIDFTPLQTQQYAFRLNRGVMNALHNVVITVYSHAAAYRSSAADIRMLV